MKRSALSFKMVKQQVLQHQRLAAAGVGSVLAGVGTVLVRQRRGGYPVLPDPASLASFTAIAVHNAAKGALITAVRESDAPDLDLILDATRRTIAEAASAGADVIPAGVGAVEGAMSVAHLVGDDKIDVGRRAAAVALEQSGSLGVPAAARMHEALAPYLPDHERPSEESWSD